MDLKDHNNQNKFAALPVRPVDTSSTVFQRMGTRL